MDHESCEPYPNSPCWWFCEACDCWYHTTGSAPMTADNRENELNEHLAELHD